MTVPPPPPPPAPPKPPAPRPPEGVLRKFRIELIAAGLALVFLATLIVPTYLLGGFERRGKRELPQVPAGKTVAYGEYKITPIGARLLDRHPTSEFDDEKGHAYLVMQLTVENLTKQPAYSLDRLLLLGKPVFTEDTAPENIGLVSDNSSVAQMQPRVPVTVQAIWQIPDAQAEKIGDTVDVMLQKQEFSEGYFSQREEWRLPRPWLVIVTPVVKEDEGA